MKTEIKTPDSQFNNHAFHEDIAILLDIYQDGDTLSVLIDRLSVSSSSPATKEYSLEWVATEIFQPQILELNAARTLKKAGSYLPVKQFREMLTCMAILSNDVLKCFMSEVVWDLKHRGVDGVYAMQVLEFCAKYLNSPIRHTHADFDLAQKATKEEVIALAKYIIKSLVGQKVLKTSQVHQNSKVLAFSFGDLNLCDSTIVFLMYWLRDLNYPIKDILESDIWQCFGLSKARLISRLKTSPLDNFFSISNVWEVNLKYKHSTSTDAINRLKLLGFS